MKCSRWFALLCLMAGPLLAKGLDCEIFEPRFTGDRYAVEMLPGILRVATPKFTPPDGAYENFIQLAITSNTPGAIIHYTLDGSTPDETSPEYSTPITITQFTYVRAIAVADKRVNSLTAEGFFSIVTTNPNYVGPPTLYVDAHRRIETRKKSLIIEGEAKGPQGIARVEYRVSGERKWKTVDGTMSWSVKIELKPVVTMIEFRAVGGDLLTSEIQKLTIKRGKTEKPKG